MTSFNFTFLSTTPQSLISGETGFVAASGNLVVAATPVVTMNSGSLIVEGGLVGATFDVATVTLAGGPDIFVGATGTIVSTKSQAILAANTASVDLTNNGEIFGREGAIRLLGGSATIINTGVIEAALSTALYCEDNNLDLINTGQIIGQVYGIQMSQVRQISSAIVHNQGIISGPFDAISLAGGADKVVNSGTLVGGVWLAAGDDRFNGRLGVQDWVRGSVGNDTIIGGHGDDSLNGSGGLRITGADNDVLYGHEGNDSLLGGDGTDLMWGGSGDDTVDGEAGADSLYGGTGDDVLTGGTEADALVGGAGEDSLNGGAGNDSMIGGDDSDWYFVDTAVDQITEAATGGAADRVLCVTSYVLAAGVYVELLTTTQAAGTTAVNLTGNEVAQSVIGNAGVNALNGGLGNDTLTGLAGVDVFVFNTTLGGGNIDRISDFSVADDTIQIDNAVFAGLADGALAASALRPTRPDWQTDALQRIIYESDTGEVYFDGDGNGAAKTAVHFATVAVGLALTSADFTVI